MHRSTRSEPAPALGSEFLWTFLFFNFFLHTIELVLIFVVNQREGVWMGRANILILPSLDEESRQREENTNHFFFCFFQRKKKKKVGEKSFSWRWHGMYSIHLHWENFPPPVLFVLFFVLRWSHSFSLHPENCTRSVQVLIGPPRLWRAADKWSIAPLRQVGGKRVWQSTSPPCDEPEIDREFCTRGLTSIFPWKSELFQPTSLVESEIWYEVPLLAALWFRTSSAATPFLRA